ncbi:enteropeptidase-like isoform X1 [Contarinia nasturtii]|uniref:enteropeptidase-like isoform X1 n=1 Tax=Contarinia nasturtii TaxID=265458 RepID=UPI0012D3F6FD|nr:enteropeptidase-like isoform X1 [Contarinia nasturtii]
MNFILRILYVGTILNGLQAEKPDSYEYDSTTLNDYGSGSEISSSISDSSETTDYYISTSADDIFTRVSYIEHFLSFLFPDFRRKCDTNEFACKNGMCIPSFWRCDNFSDCSDKSDESNCAKVTTLMPDDSTTEALPNTNGHTTESDESDEPFTRSNDMNKEPHS